MLTQGMDANRLDDRSTLPIVGGDVRTKSTSDIFQTIYPRQSTMILTSVNDIYEGYADTTLRDKLNDPKSTTTTMRLVIPQPSKRYSYKQSTRLCSLLGCYKCVFRPNRNVWYLLKCYKNNVFESTEPFPTYDNHELISANIFLFWQSVLSASKHSRIMDKLSNNINSYPFSGSIKSENVGRSNKDLMFKNKDLKRHASSYTLIKRFSPYENIIKKQNPQCMYGNCPKRPVNGKWNQELNR